MNSSPLEPCSLSLQLVSLRLESPVTSSQVSVALPKQILHVVLCVLGYTTLLLKNRVVLGLRCCLSLLCDLFKIDLLKLDDLLAILCRWPSVPAILLAYGMRFLSMRAKMSSKVFWNLAATFATYSFAYDACCPWSCLFLSASNLSCRLSFLLSLDNLLDLNLHFMLFVLRNPSLQSTWLHQRSVTVCCPLSIPQLRSPLQSQLGVLLLSRQPSILALLQYVDDFQYPCLSSSVQLFSSRHCSPRTFHPALLFSVLLILPCCWLCSSRLLTRLRHFVQLSEILVDHLLFVVQVLRLCAPFRQSGVASFVNFFSPRALLAVVLSLFSVFFRRLLQHSFVVVYCSEVRLRHLQLHYSVCATSWLLVRGRCSGSAAP